MSELVIGRGAAMELPQPKVAITIRRAVLADVVFIDSLQKRTTRQVGFMPTKQLEGKVAAGHVLVAERRVGFIPPAAVDAEEDGGLKPTLREPVGYLIGHDQYFKRDDVGIIYQINVVEAYRRSFVAAAMLKAQFERSAYGCKLYCCWCAQDIEANRFWESMGFVPLAYRAGSEAKARVHIFWQKRIREGDATTPWWFPSLTTGGSLRADRIVLPIPPGTHWSDEKTLILPNEMRQLAGGDAPKALPGPRRPRVAKMPVARPTGLSAGGLWFAAKPVAAQPEPAKPERAKRTKRTKTKNAPALVAAARELRDRWLEHINATPILSVAKYEVSRRIESTSPPPRPAELLAA